VGDEVLAGLAPLVGVALAREDERVRDGVAVDLDRRLGRVLLDDREQVAEQALLGGGERGELGRRRRAAAARGRALDRADRCALGDAPRAVGARLGAAAVRRGRGLLRLGRRGGLGGRLGLRLRLGLGAARASRRAGLSALPYAALAVAVLRYRSPSSYRR
jgi:hypothetical protein